jgi:hypothetical protein
MGPIQIFPLQNQVTMLAVGSPACGQHTTSPMTFLGIDNGISGACAFLGPLGSLIDVTVMPVTVIERRSKSSKKMRKVSEINVNALAHWVRSINAKPHETIVMIEEPCGSKSASAAKSMAGSFHALRALFQLAGYTVERVDPSDWQKPLLKAKSGNTKPAALALARRTWPGENWLATKRSKVPDSGIVDAALIALYAQRKHTGTL